MDPASGEEVTAQNGRYGPYLKRGNDSRSLVTEDQIFTITLDEALKIYAEPKHFVAGKALRLRRCAGWEQIRRRAASGHQDGRFGPYVTDSETNSMRKGRRRGFHNRRGDAPPSCWPIAEPGPAKRLPAGKLPGRCRRKKAASATSRVFAGNLFGVDSLAWLVGWVQHVRGAQPLTNIPTQCFGVQGATDRDRRRPERGHPSSLASSNLSQATLVDRVADDGVLEAGERRCGPAMALPADTPIANSAEPSTGMSSSWSSRAADGAAPAPSGCSMGAPDVASPWGDRTHRAGRRFRPPPGRTR